MCPQSVQLLYVATFNKIGGGKYELHKQFREAVEPTKIGAVLGEVKHWDGETFYRYYLHDFVRLYFTRTNTKTRKMRSENMR